MRSKQDNILGVLLSLFLIMVCTTDLHHGRPCHPLLQRLVALNRYMWSTGHTAWDERYMAGELEVVLWFRSRRWSSGACFGS